MSKIFSHDHSLSLYLLVLIFLFIFQYASLLLKYLTPFLIISFIITGFKDFGWFVTFWLEFSFNLSSGQVFGLHCLFLLYKYNSVSYPLLSLCSTFLIPIKNCCLHFWHFHEIFTLRAGTVKLSITHPWHSALFIPVMFLMTLEWTSCAFSLIHWPWTPVKCLFCLLLETVICLGWEFITRYCFFWVRWCVGWMTQLKMRNILL